MPTRSPARRLAAAAAATLLGLGGALMAASPASAAEFSVTNLDDSGAGSLRQAVIDANGAAGPDEIVFADGLTGTITLETEIVISDALTITGPGADAITITQNDDFDFLQVDIAVGDFSISGLAFEGDGAGAGAIGRAVDIGQLEGDLTIASSTFTGLETEGSGGAVQVDEVSGDVRFERVTLDSNEARESGGGANFYAVSGTVTVVDTLVRGNHALGEHGGGVRFYDVEGGVSVTDTTFRDNSADSEGGGVQFEVADGVNSFTRVAFVGNEARNGGGMYVFTSAIEESDDDSFTIAQSTFEGNRASRGGGFAWGGTSEAPITDGLQVLVDSSTFWNNLLLLPGEGIAVGVSMYIADLLDDEVARVVNSTFDEDSDLVPAPYTIVVDATDDVVLELVHSTVVGPGGVLLFSDGAESPDGAALVSHTILSSTTDDDALMVARAGGSPTNGPADAELQSDQRTQSPDGGIRGAGPLPSAGGSIRSGFASLSGPLIPGAPMTLEWSVVSTGLAPGVAMQGAGNQLDTNPLLGVLGDNGGTTPTMLPLTGSPAINTGDPAVSGAPSTDQRGSVRIVATIDIGAVETPTPATLPATGSLVEWSWITLAGTVMLLGIALLLLLRSRRASA